jgi:hypothetical protein
MFDLNNKEAKTTRSNEELHHEKGINIYERLY